MTNTTEKDGCCTCGHVTTINMVYFVFDKPWHLLSNIFLKIIITNLSSFKRKDTCTKKYRDKFETKL